MILTCLCINHNYSFKVKYYLLFILVAYIYICKLASIIFNKTENYLTVICFIFIVNKGII